VATIPKTLGKYQILGAVGRGGMGEVYKAYQPDLHRHVAIKTLLAGEQATEEFLSRFQREARVAAKLVHPNIVQIHDIAAEGRLHYIVMEYVEGRSLKDLLAEKGKFDPETAFKIGHFVARALRFAHDQKVIHRDIKPANVLIDRQGRVKILDFGLAKSLAEGKALTVSHAMVGTPYYMSPEQAFAAPEEVDARTDLYSLGAVLYELVTGRPPFEGGTVLAILRKIEEEDPAPPGVSPAVDAVILKALAKDRDRRFQTAGEMAEAVKGCLSGAVVETAGGATGSARVAKAAAATPSFVLRVPRRAAWAAGGALAALLAALVAWAAWPSAAVPPAPPPPAPPPAPDLAAELRALLAAKTNVLSGELVRYRDDPQLRRIIAQHFVDQGQYSRALEYLKGYERTVYELASAKSLQRFVSPVLFRLSTPTPRDLKGPGPEFFLIEALKRHLEGKPSAARLKLKSAENSRALASHVLLVRAHVDLVEVWDDPAGKGAPTLAALRRDLNGSDALFLLPLRAVAAHLAGDEPAAEEALQQFGARTGNAAEYYLVSSILLQRAGKIEDAQDQLKDAHLKDPNPRNLDISVHRAYLRWLEVLRDPRSEKLHIDPSKEKFDVEKMYAEDMREVLDDRLQSDHYPAALFLRGVLNALESKWAPAEEDFRFMERRVGDLSKITVDHERLAAFAYAGTARSRLLDAACDLQLHLGRREAALATALTLTGEDLPEEDRYPLLVQNHLRIARLVLADEARALRHLEEALKLGVLPEDLRNDAELGALRSKQEFQELLKAYRRNHWATAKMLLMADPPDEATALHHLDEALKLGVTPQELLADGELGEFRKKPSFMELLKRYED
jgi:tRNA A-37 threonylcarbamoyl transferase component Bud32